ncbi:MAG: hypothetical protein ACRDMV_19200 [Streptosporangiales bacterium]
MANTLRTRVRELEEQLADTRQRLTRLGGEHVEVADQLSADETYTEAIAADLAELIRTIRPRGENGAEQ